MRQRASLSERTDQDSRPGRGDQPADCRPRAHDTRGQDLLGLAGELVASHRDARPGAATAPGPHNESLSVSVVQGGDCEGCQRGAPATTLLSYAPCTTGTMARPIRL